MKYDILKPYLRQNWKGILFGLFSLIIVDFLQLLIPIVIKWAIDSVTVGNVQRRELLFYALYIIFLGVAIAVFRFFWRYFIFGTSRKIEEGLRNKIFSHMQILSLHYFNRTKTGDIMAHATNDLEAIRMAAGMGVVAFIDGIILSFAGICFMVHINKILTIISLTPMFILFLITYRFSSLLHRRFRKVQEVFSQLTERVRESFSGIRVIKAYVKEDMESDKLRNVGKEYIDANMKLVKIWGAFFPLVMLFSNLSMAFVIFLGGRQVILGVISPGDFVAFNSYLAILAWPMMAIGWVTNVIQRGRVSLDRINKILEVKPEIYDSPHVKKDFSIKGKIEFKSLFFSYPRNNNPILNNINLTINHGETIGIVGRIGCGKTTLSNLLLRFLEPKTGQILIDGEEIHKIPLNVLRRNISYVPQNAFLFSTSIKENIIFGRIDACEDEITRVVILTQLFDEIRELPDGIDSIIGERGVTLSGGQKQRITLARALLKPSPIIILDDALSSV
ncbi:MAG: ABC transporter transmembrane domain-containing protein, partial [Thermodesulfobacteriota bacterium]|nr:ABC transporter transmembrane domain-containing protein [Thermodesulfobacteriota bacterium]